MKLRWLKIASVILALSLVFAAALPAFSAEGGKLETMITVRASEIKNFGTYRAVQAALDSARYSATSDNIYRVVVEPGSYDLTRALHIYSNTVLYLGGVSFVRNKGCKANMLRTGDYETESKGATGYAAHSNIEIRGGIFDGSGTANTVMKVAHAKNFRLVNVSLKNVHNGHLMEVAGVDGFHVTDCRFENQTLDSKGIGYEAIQLDILKSGHICDCRSEAIPVKNVTIEGCTFNNVPRGIGSHTMVLNVPFTGIRIKGNRFTNLTSAAVQGVNWKDCKITENIISNTPRGIAIYSLLSYGVGGYYADTLAREGKTSATASGEYKTPTDSKLLIADNVITYCGRVRDDYASYEYAGITVTGKRLGGVYSKFDDGSGGLPAGDYYITGVTLRGNLIEADGHGIRLENVRDAKLEANSLTCGVNSYDNVKYHGLTIKGGSRIDSIIGCDVYGSLNSGIYVDASRVNAIVNTGLSGSGTDGISLNNKSVIGVITENYILKCGQNGIHVLTGSDAGNVAGNTISGCKKKPVLKDKKTKGKIGKNSYTAAELTYMALDTYEVTLGAGETFEPALSYEPLNAAVRFVWSSTDRAVASVTPTGKITANSRGTAEIYVRASNGDWCRVNVTVLDAPDSLGLNAHMLILGEGEEFDLNSKIPKGTASRVIEYTSNNPDAVSVSASGGRLCAESLGTATVIAKTYNGLIANCNVIVKEAPSYIALDKTSLGMGVGETSVLNASIPEASASKLTWRSDNPDVVSVSKKGELIAKSEGRANISVSTYNGCSESCEIVVKGEPQSIALADEMVTLAPDEKYTLEYEIDGSRSRSVSFKSSDPKVCSVDRSTGELTARSEGKAQIVVTSYNGKSDSVEVSVRQDGIIIRSSE